MRTAEEDPLCACFILVRCLGRRICSRGPALFLGCQSPACGGACRPCWKSLSSWRQRSPPRQPHRFGGRRTPALAGGPAGEECQTPSASDPPSGRPPGPACAADRFAESQRAMVCLRRWPPWRNLRQKQGPSRCLQRWCPRRH